MCASIDTTVGKALKHLRIDAGLSQHQLALRLHTSQTFVSNVESGKRSLRVSEFELYAQAFGFTTERLYTAISKALFAHQHSEDESEEQPEEDGEV